MSEYCCLERWVEVVGGYGKKHNSIVIFQVMLHVT